MADQPLTYDDQLVADAINASTGIPTLGTTTIEHHPDHAYVKGPKGARGCKALTSAGVPCNRAQMDPLHHLPTLNLFGSGNHWQTFQNAKRHWTTWLHDALEAAGLPHGLDSVLVEAKLCFPTQRRRDQGNHRYFIEKVLGDVLHEGGWIPDDTWEHYEFGNLACVIRPGERWLSIALMPNALAASSQTCLDLGTLAA
jgi:hypothetical protein